MTADTSAVALLELKVRRAWIIAQSRTSDKFVQKANFSKYWELLRRMFDTVNPKNAGMSYLRVSLGASDLSPYGQPLSNCMNCWD